MVPSWDSKYHLWFTDKKQVAEVAVMPKVYHFSLQCRNKTYGFIYLENLLLYPFPGTDLL